MTVDELDYDEAREALARALFRDAELHEKGRRKDIDVDFLELCKALPG